MRTLRNAVDQNNVHHAYLFVGSRGTGKTSMAKILASALNCTDGPRSDFAADDPAVEAIAAGTSLDVQEIDAASHNGVDDIRDLIDSVATMATTGGWKVYILDEAHMITPQGWNAFLKTLEEPPPNTVFVLATTEANKVLPTVADRCHRFDFRRPTVEQLSQALRRAADAEGIEIGDDAVAMIARSATGSFRDALGTLEQLVTYGGKNVDAEDVQAVLGVADFELALPHRRRRRGWRPARRSGGRRRPRRQRPRHDRLRPRLRCAHSQPARHPHARRGACGDRPDRRAVSAAGRAVAELRAGAQRPHARPAFRDDSDLEGGR